MKLIITAALVAASVVATGAARAATIYEVQWINQCIKDNKDEGVKDDVVLKYCTCMNNKMDSKETQSITQWEKTHKTEADECVDKAGWK